jgi:hypothetical protein
MTQTDAPDTIPGTAEAEGTASGVDAVDTYLDAMLDDGEGGDDAVAPSHEEQAQPQEPDEAPREAREAIADDYEVEVTLPGGEKTTVPLSELRRGYSREQDYTQKTMAVADQRKAFDGKLAQLDAKMGEYLAPLERELTELAKTDWESLIAEDPIDGPARYAQYQAKLERWQRVSGEQQAVQQERQRMAAEEFEQYRAEEARKFYDKHPEYAHPEKGAQAWDAFNQYMAAQGYSREEISRLADHRTASIIEKARRWDDLQAQKAKLTEQKQDAPKFQKPGARRDPAQERTQEYRETLARAKRNPTSSNIDALLEHYL